MQKSSRLSKSNAFNFVLILGIVNLFSDTLTDKVVKMRFDDKTVERLQKIAWWDWSIEKSVSI